MITLRKFYDLLHKSATVTLCDQKLTETFYEGKVSGIPAQFDDCRVLDFSMSNSGHLLFEIERNKPKPRRTNDSPIARMRRAKGMTQGQLAEKVGCYTKDISRWENGERRPASKSLKALADALGCAIDELMEE